MQRICRVILLLSLAILSLPFSGMAQDLFDFFSAKGLEAKKVGEGTAAESLFFPGSEERKASGEKGKPSEEVPERFSGIPEGEAPAESTGARRPATRRPEAEPLSPVEKAYLERTGDYGVELRQVGYDFLRSSPARAPSPPVPPPSSYRLGPGDELFLYLIGPPPGLDLSSVSHLIVDREGRIYLPGLGVLPVWGRTVAETEEILSRRLKANLRLTPGRLRYFPVYVSGEVKDPGAVLVSGVDTVVEALSRAGGATKLGSLRRIRLTRDSGEEILIDLYDLILRGRPLRHFLRDGDVIFVPPLAHTAAVGGEVRRPGIYEFRPGETVADLFSLAGGILPSGYRYRVILERYRANEELFVREFALEDPALGKLPLEDGDLLIIRKVTSLKRNSLRVEGHTPYPGVYEYRPGLTLSAFLTEDFFFPDTSLETAIVERDEGRNPRYISFSPADVLSGRFDLALEPGDVIRLFPARFYEPVRLAGCVDSGFVPYREGLTLKKALAGRNFCREVGLLKAEIYRSGKKGLERVKKIYLSDLLLRDRSEADVPLSPGDLVIVRVVSPGEAAEEVSVAGQVLRPGTYPLREGMRLYDLLKLAGGFRKRAYPAGLVLVRESVAALQRERLRWALIRMRKTLEKEEAGILQAELSPAEKMARQEAFKARRRLLALMEKVEVTGRITGLRVPEDLEALKDSPSNVLLEPGDRIYVPRRPANVLVFGEVNNPSALLYREGLSVRDYIRLAGGFGKFADKKEIFVIRANGEAFSGAGGPAIGWDPEGRRFVAGGQVLNYKPRPGEAIVVPTKIKVPVMWRPLIRDVIQIIYQSALTVFTITNL